MEKIICWRGTDGDIKPVKCICDTEFGYPNYCTDENGKYQMMYENTHFENIKDAWESIVHSVKAGVSLSGGDVINCRRSLKEAEAIAADSAARYTKVKRNSENPFRKNM